MQSNTFLARYPLKTVIFGAALRDIVGTFILGNIFYDVVCFDVWDVPYVFWDYDRKHKRLKYRCPLAADKKVAPS
jgi:hypothetical protein